MAGAALFSVETQNDAERNLIYNYFKFNIEIMLKMVYTELYYEPGGMDMKIILDVMGADHEPAEIIKGAVLARREYGTDMTLVGDGKSILDTLASLGEKAEDYTVVDEPSFISMEDSPMLAASSKHKSSMAKALHMLADGEGDAVVSCGNTGALFTGATLIVRRIKGVRRAALGMLLCYEMPILMLDCGANVTVTSEYLVQFAYLGSAYMQKVYGIESPRVGLLNNGTEEHKGTPTIVEAHNMLKEAADINFVGNVEGKEVPFGVCDVLVCDGFSGNIMLKTSEGIAKYAMKRLKELFGSGLTAKLAGLAVRRRLKGLRKFFDPREYGGAPFLGLSKPVIKAHGNSDANAVKNAIRQASAYAETGVTDAIAKHAESFPAAAQPVEKKPAADNT